MNYTLPLGLFGYGLELKGSLTLYVLLTLLAVLAALFVYRFTLPPVPVWRRAILTVLRIAALAAILLLLFEPVLNIFRHHLEKQNVLVLVDKSASMSVQDGETPRREIVDNVLSGSGLATLADKAQLRYFSFSDSVTALTRKQLDTTKAFGVGTNLSFAWETASGAFAHEPTSAVVLISDGGNNLGPNPARLAGLSNLPIYTVGVGDTTVRRDAVVNEILANDVTYLNSIVPVDVRIKATGLGGKTTSLRLLDRSGVEVAREQVHLTGDVSEVTVPLKFTATQAGQLRYRVVLDSVVGEWSLTNNRRSVMIRVLETRSQVVILSGPPTPSLSALRHTLEVDSNLEVRAFIESARGDYYLESSPTADDLAKASLIVLMNFPSRETKANLLSSIVDVVSSRKIPLMFFAGPATYKPSLDKMAEVIPFQMQRGALRETEVTLRAVEIHPALASGGPLSIPWTDLPPAFGSSGNFAKGALPQVIATLSSVTLGIEEDEPAILSWSGGGRKGIAFLVWGTNRWKLGLAKDSRGASFYDDLISRFTRWLVSPIEEKHVRIHPNKSLFSGGERVFFQAQVYGADLTPRDDAAVVVRVMMGEHSEALPLQGRGHGRYEAAFLPWEEGEYRFEGVAYVDHDTLGRETGAFAVEAFNIEMLDTRQRADILQNIAKASGGHYAPAANADTMLANLEMPLQDVEYHREIPLWNRAIMLWIIIGALGLEWIIRKRSGML